MSTPDRGTDRFGTPEAAIVDARNEHSHIYRTGTHVPTRNDVATMPPDDLYRVIDEWLWESPAQLIPNDKQIAEVLTVLEARRDRGAVARIIAECRRYLNA